MSFAQALDLGAVMILDYNITIVFYASIYLLRVTSTTN